MDKENKRRLMIRMDEIKDETKHAIGRIIESHSEKRKYSTKKELTTIVANKFIDIMSQKGIKVDSMYLEGELNVLLSELESRGKISDDYLWSQVNRFLNRHIEYAIEDTETDEKKSNLRRSEFRTEEIIDEDKSERHRVINNNQVSKIEEYVHDIFSHTMRILEYRGINISQKDREELQYEVLSELKNRASNHMTSFFENDNNELSEQIRRNLLEFFEAINHEFSQEEQSEDKKEKKPWELSRDEKENINPYKALKKAESNRQGIQNVLPDNVID